MHDGALLITTTFSELELPILLVFNFAFTVIPSPSPSPVAPSPARVPKQVEDPEDKPRPETLHQSISFPTSSSWWCSNFTLAWTHHLETS